MEQNGYKRSSGRRCTHNAKMQEGDQPGTHFPRLSQNCHSYFSFLACGTRKGFTLPFIVHSTTMKLVYVVANSNEVALLRLPEAPKLAKQTLHHSCKLPEQFFFIHKSDQRSRQICSCLDLVTQNLILVSRAFTEMSLSMAGWGCGFSLLQKNRLARVPPTPVFSFSRAIICNPCHYYFLLPPCSMERTRKAGHKVHKVPKPIRCVSVILWKSG